MSRQLELSPTAHQCLDRQLAEALDLAVACRELSVRVRCDGDPLTVVVLQRLASDLTDIAASLLPLVGIEPVATIPLSREGFRPGADTWPAELDNRLGLAGLAAEVDAMTPALEAGVVRLLSKLAALYQGSRELLLAATAGDRA